MLFTKLAVLPVLCFFNFCTLHVQLIAPDKVEIPDRLIEYEDVELSPDQERQKQKKIRAIESMLSRSG